KVDWYKVTGLAWRQLLDVDLTVPETATFKLTYHKGLRGQQRPGGLLFGPGTHDKVIHHIGSGDYYIRVELLDGYGEYTLTLRGGGHEGDPLSPQFPTPDGVSIPFLKKDPSVASGSSCRGACGSGCPDTCETQPDIFVRIPDPDNDASHYLITYPGVIRCGTHEGCRWHDWCFDECAKRYGERSALDDCHLRCSNTVRKRYDDWDAINWALGKGPYDGYLLFSDPPIWEGPFSGSPDLVTYVIWVTTADKWGAGTDARIFITLFGTDGRTTGEIRLDTPDWNDFEQGRTDAFVIEGKENVGDIDRIEIRHDNTGDWAGWYLDNVYVGAHRPSEDGGTLLGEWSFTVNR
ncbi:MAG: hypothetical protein KAU10_01425, partial [Dehalococcoidia bacterium]|nr:hypothetical protein [Dehalococcoidia bacterium]